MVDYVGAGFTPMEALMTGTVNAATAGGIKEVGRLEPGMAADVVAMAKSPLDDIQAVMDVSFVMRGGIVYKNAGAAR
jgi:imidazolonepropionase-like amidohydrolase